MIILDVIVLDLFDLTKYSLILGMECLWVGIFDVIFILLVIVVLIIVIVIVMRLFVFVMFWLLDFDDVI